MVILGMENKMKTAKELSSVWLARAKALPLRGSPTGLYNDTLAVA